MRKWIHFSDSFPERGKRIALFRSGVDSGIWSSVLYEEDDLGESASFIHPNGFYSAITKQHLMSCPFGWMYEGDFMNNCKEME